MPEYSGAVLIIGSLWWDTSPVRVNWRNTRLDMENTQTVYAPIRYGRRSGEQRRNTFTMVFSVDCYNVGMGKALLVPLKTKAKNLDDLITEAKRLWEAEGGVVNRISGTWGAVGLSVNPESSLPNEIIDGWKSFYSGQERQPDFRPIGNEIPSFSADGILMLEWLENIENKKVTKFDFILATATLPNIEEYPSANVIAQACLDNHYTEYFDRNQMHGITTFQDEEILKLLHPNK